MIWLSLIVLLLLFGGYMVVRKRGDQPAPLPQPKASSPSPAALSPSEPGVTSLPASSRPTTTVLKAGAKRGVGKKVEEEKPAVEAAPTPAEEEARLKALAERERELRQAEDRWLEELNERQQGRENKEPTHDKQRLAEEIERNLDNE